MNLVCVGFWLKFNIFPEIPFESFISILGHLTAKCIVELQLFSGQTILRIMFWLRNFALKLAENANYGKYLHSNGAIIGMERWSVRSGCRNGGQNAPAKRFIRSPRFIDVFANNNSFIGQIGGQLISHKARYVVFTCQLWLAIKAIQPVLMICIWTYLILIVFILVLFHFSNQPPSLSLSYSSSNLLFVINFAKRL